MKPNILLFALIFLLSNGIQTVAGFAGSVLAMPFGIALIGKSTAAGQINLLGAMVSLYVALRERKHIQWRHLARIVPLMALGMLGGKLVQQALQFDLIYRFYGGFILVLAAFMAFRKNGRFHSPVTGFLLLFLAGAIHQVFVSGGPLLVIYAASRIPKKADFRATLNAIWVPIDCLLIGEHFMAGIYTPAFFKLSFVLFPVMILGIFIGYRVYDRVSGQVFQKTICALLAAIGLYILIS